MDYSQFTLYSLGIVAEDIALNQDLIKVWPFEHLPLEHGSLSENDRIASGSILDSAGKKRNVALEGGKLITAKWTPLGSPNRDTPPTVRRAETVLIYRYADTNRFYWQTFMNEPKLRRLEAVRYAWSNKPQGTIEAYDENSSYWLEVNTLAKHIRLHTATNDNEQAGYDLTINTGDGIVTFEDTRGNFFRLNSVEGTLESNINERITSTTETLEMFINTFGKLEGPKLDFGEPGNLEPSVLGDKLAEWIVGVLVPWLNAHNHIGNLGKPTSPASVGTHGPYEAGDGAKGGNVYSTRNRNQ